MARTPKTAQPEAAETQVDEQKLAGAMAQMREDAGSTAMVLAEQTSRVAALAAELNYNGSTDLGVLENSAKDAIRRIGAGIFELGGYLLMLREVSTRGQFLPALERLGIGSDAAQRYMAVTRRFANAATSRHFEQVGFSKLVELLPLEDEQVAELTEVGHTGELALDDVAGMTVRELRASVRKARAEAEKQKARADRQEAVNTELHEEVRLIKRMPPSEELKRTQHEAAEIQAELLGRIQGELRASLVALNNCETDQSLFMAGMVGQLIGELVTLRDEFTLPEVGGTPEWETWAGAQDSKTATASKAKPN